jgi:hypothetical protein
MWQYAGIVSNAMLLEGGCVSVSIGRRDEGTDFMFICIMHVDVAPSQSLQIY